MESSIYYFKKYLIIYTVIYCFFFWYKLEIPKEIIFLILYTIYIFIWSFYNGIYETKGIANSAFLANISTISVIIIIYNTNFSDKFIHSSLVAIKITVLLAVIVTFIQTVDYSFLDANPIYAERAGRLDMGDTLTGSLYRDRRLSIFGFVDSNELGLSFFPLLAVLLGFLLFNKQKSILFLFSGSIIAFLSNNRYVMVGYIIITFQYYIGERFKSKAIFRYGFMAVIVIIVTIQILEFVGYDFSDWFAQRLLPEGSIQRTTRYAALENFIIFFPKAVFFGTGVHLTAELARAVASVGSSQIHVGYLQHLVSYGLVGSFFLFGFWFLLAKKLYRTARISGYWGSFFAFLVFFWANFTLVKYSIFYYGLIFALIFNKYFQDKNMNNPNK